MKYFDYAATTPIDETVYEIYTKVGHDYFFNSGCNKVSKMQETISRNTILNAIGLHDGEHDLVFTSGGTESNNLAILGFAKTLTEPKHFITTCFEHASVNSCFAELENQGHTVTYVTVDTNGHINPQDVFDAITADTVFVSIMSVNNELGSRQPIEEVFKYIKANYPHIVTMSDFVQGLGKITIDYTDIDLFTISSHKIYGPKGVGGVVKRKNVALKPLIYGGTNEFNMRAGLQSLPAQTAFAQAVVHILDHYDSHLAQINKTRDYFIDLVKQSDVLHQNCQTEANVVSIRVDSEKENSDLLDLMEERGFFLSARSGDSAGIKLYSRSLLGIGLTHEQIDRTLRVSFSHLTQMDDVKELVENLEDVVRNN